MPIIKHFRFDHDLDHNFLSSEKLVHHFIQQQKDHALRSYEHEQDDSIDVIKAQFETSPSHTPPLVVYKVEFSQNAEERTLKHVLDAYCLTKIKHPYSSHETIGINFTHFPMKDIWAYQTHYDALENYASSDATYSQSTNVLPHINRLLQSCKNALDSKTSTYKELAYLLGLATKRLDGTLTDEELEKHINKLPGTPSLTLQILTGCLLALSVAIVMTPLHAPVIAASCALAGLGLFDYNSRTGSSRIMSDFNDAVKQDNIYNEILAY